MTAPEPNQPTSPTRLEHPSRMFVDETRDIPTISKPVVRPDRTFLFYCCRGRAPQRQRALPIRFCEGQAG